MQQYHHYSPNHSSSRDFSTKRDAETLIGFMQNWPGKFPHREELIETLSQHPDDMAVLEYTLHQCENVQKNSMNSIIDDFHSVLLSEIRRLNLPLFQIHCHSQDLENFMLKEKVDIAQLVRIRNSGHVDYYEKALLEMAKDFLHQACQDRQQECAHSAGQQDNMKSSYAQIFREALMQHAPETAKSHPSWHKVSQEIATLLHPHLETKPHVHDVPPRLIASAPELQHLLQELIQIHQEFDSSHDEYQYRLMSAVEFVIQSLSTLLYHVHRIHPHREHKIQLLKALDDLTSHPEIQETPIAHPIKIAHWPVNAHADLLKIVTMRQKNEQNSEQEIYEEIFNQLIKKIQQQSSGTSM